MSERTADTTATLDSIRETYEHPTMVMGDWYHRRSVAFLLTELDRLRESTLALHKPIPYLDPDDNRTWRNSCGGCDWDYYPCPTARVFGVTA